MAIRPDEQMVTPGQHVAFPVPSPRRRDLDVPAGLEEVVYV